MTIDGAESTWTGLTDLSVGVDGPGRLNLRNQGSVSVDGNVTIGTSGTIDVGPGDAEINAPVLNRGTGNVQAGSTLTFTRSVRGAGNYTDLGTVVFQDTFSPGESTAAISFDGNVVIDATGTLEIEIAASTEDQINAANDVTLRAGSTLTLDAIEHLSIKWGNATRTIITGNINGQFTNEPPVRSGQPFVGHLGRGVYLTDEGPNSKGISYFGNSVKVDLFQAAPGDIDGNRRVNGYDILSFLMAGLFGDGVTPEANWTNGDFNGDHKVSGSDILEMLGAGLFGDGTYADATRAATAGADVKLVVTEGGLVIDTDGATVTGFVLSSESGILTGDDADNLGLFQEDTDATISGTFAMSLKGEHGLGDVIGETDVDLGGDLSLAYTIAGVPGIFTASVVVPEPGTLVMLSGGLIGLLIWRRRRAA